jgi:hypothetical protein
MSNVVVLRRRTVRHPERAWSELTQRLVMDRARHGTLEPGIVQYLLAAVFQ